MPRGYKFNEINELHELLQREAGALIIPGMARRINKKKPRRLTGRGATFLPDLPDVVKAIAMQGCTDDEIAFSFGLDPKIIKGWRKMYGDFDKAIEEGRTIADLQVVEALHKRAVGFKRTYDVAKPVGRGDNATIEVVTLEEDVIPETNSIKFWLSNRDPERWNRAARNLRIGGEKGGEPINMGVKNETKMELVSSILSLIQPKPDGA